MNKRKRGKNMKTINTTITRKTTMEMNMMCTMCMMCNCMKQFHRDVFHVDKYLERK